MRTILVTGGAGFIGGCYVRRLFEAGDVQIVNLDKLTYAGNLDSIPEPGGRHRFIQGDICDRELVGQILQQHKPSAIVHFAAESHVDRSIDGPAEFVQTNVVGACNLLDRALDYYRGLSEGARESFRFLHVSTDEVYGSLGDTGKFTTETPYAPNSPYSASKASSDMFVRAYHHTYGFPTLTTNCSNNYGPYQFPEKLVPLMILNALEGKSLPVYGDGQHIRDWLFVDDHCRAIDAILDGGRVGEVYNIGGDSEKTNLEVVETICDLIDERAKPARSARELITFVQDRPGHDRRYAIDASKLQQELGWTPSRSFAEGFATTVQWYLDNLDWVRDVTSGAYQRTRLGLLQDSGSE